MRQAGLQVTRTGVSTDQPDELAALLRRHAPAVDLIVTTGGVSKGAYEVVRQAMAGHDVEFGAVAMQPGGPQGIGSFDGVPVLGFPGNPVSCLVSFEMFLRPRPHRAVRRPGAAARRPRAPRRAADLPGGQAPGAARHAGSGRHGPAGGRRGIPPGPCPGPFQRPGPRAGGNSGARSGRRSGSMDPVNDVENPEADATPADNGGADNGEADNEQWATPA